MMDHMAYLKSEEIIDATSIKKTYAHSHIKGLGLHETLEPYYISEGMVGQLDARKAAGVIVTMIKERKLSGRSVLLTGPSGTGKTAIAKAIAHSLGPDTPFTSLSAAEVCSLVMSKAEILTQALRKSISIRTKEQTEIIVGEAVEIEIDKPATGGGSKSGKIKMRTTDMETIYELGSKMVDELMKEMVTTGDVISINKSTGKITKIDVPHIDSQGHVFMRIERPKGELQKMREVVYNVKLHEIDCINSRSLGFLTMFSGDTGEINSDIRFQVDAKILEWIEGGKAELIPGVLFIDEVHLLDLECFTFLSSALENELAPTIIMATNVKVANVRGTNYTASHGIPLDFLDRIIVIETNPYDETDLREILKCRCKAENAIINEAALQVLTKITAQTSLHYGTQIISLAVFIAEARKSPEGQIFIEDLRKVYSLFWDTKQAVRFLQRMENRFHRLSYDGDDIKVTEEDPPVQIQTEICDLEIPL